MGLDQLSGGFLSLFSSTSLVNAEQVDPQTRPSAIGPPFTGHFRVLVDTPRGLQPFQPGPNATVTSGKPHAATERAMSATPAGKTDMNLGVRRNIYDEQGKEVASSEDKEKQQTNGDTGAANGAAATADAAAKAMETASREPRKTINCFSCGVDCTRLRFHYAKSAPISANANAPDTKYDVCPNCFLQGRIPASHNASDFVKLEDRSHSTVPDKDAPWTDSELILLLEAVEQFDDNWQQVAEHVGTRTAEECVLKFLSLEIEDKYLEDPEISREASLRALGGREPISQVDNPVLSVVAFLAQMADPAVAAAAAGRSVEEIKKDLRKQLGQDKDKGKGKEGEELKTEDVMDIDSGRPEESTSKSKASLSTIALGASAARAGALASHEEREMTRLVSAAVNVTLQKLEIKLQQFNEMEEIIEAERRELEQARQQLFLDRMAFKKRVKDVQDALQAMSVRGPGEETNAVLEDALSGINHRYQFQPTNPDARNGVQPLSAEAGSDYRNFEVP